MRIDLIATGEIGPVEQRDWARFQAQERSIAKPGLSAGWARCVSVARPDARVAVISDAAGRTHGFLPVQAGKGLTIEPLAASLNLGCGVVGDPALTWGAAEWLRDLRARDFPFAGAPETQAEFARYARGSDLRMIAELHGGAQAFHQRRWDRDDIDVPMVRAKRLDAIASGLGATKIRCFSTERSDFDQTLFWSAGAFRRPQEEWEIAALRAAFEAEDDDFRGALFTLKADETLIAGAFFILNNRSAQLVFYGEAPQREAFEPAAVVVADAIAAFAGMGIQEADLGPVAGPLAREFSTRRRPVLYGRIRPAEQRRFPASMAAAFPRRAMRDARSWSHAGPGTHPGA
jgi:CelD/BcsL family acetyltransferase involved in cellulose biosynthesis